MKKVLIVVILIVGLVGVMSAQRMIQRVQPNVMQQRMANPIAQRMMQRNIQNPQKMLVKANQGMNLKTNYVILVAEKYSPDLVSEFKEIYALKEGKVLQMDFDNMTLAQIREHREKMTEIRNELRKTLFDLNKAVSEDNSNLAKGFIEKLLILEKQIIELHK